MQSTTHLNHFRGFTTQNDKDLDEAENCSDEDEDDISDQSDNDGSESISMQEEISGDDSEELSWKKQKPISKEDVSYESSSDMSDEEDMVSAAKCDDLRARSLLDVETYKDISEETGDTKRPLWMRIQEATGNKSLTLRKVIDDWINEGNPISRAVVVFTITVLRRRKKYWRALEVLFVFSLLVIVITDSQCYYSVQEKDGLIH